MHADPLIPVFVFSIFAILMVGVILKRMNQPHVVAYLLAGFFLGPHMLSLITDQELLGRAGSIGVIFLLFFVGMEISPSRLAESWVISVIGTFLQIAVSVLLVGVVGYFFDWKIERVVLIGFVISLSSTAVVLKLLEGWKEIDSRVGQDVLGILLVQDLLIVPMLISLKFLGGLQPSMQSITLQVLGGIGILAFAGWIIKKDQIHLPWLKYFKQDHELQLFTSLGICFGMAFITGMMELSAALGAFIGGMLVGSARETQWVHHNLSSIRTIFIALFFVSVGMLIDLDYIIENFKVLTLLVILALGTNTLINALILRFLGESWEVSFYGGSLLSQIGEFSFIIASVGYQSKIITTTTYEMTIAVIAITLLLSPPWILLIKQLTSITSRKLESS